MSNPIKIEKVDPPKFRPDRSLSDNFESQSENSKQFILGFTEGIKPSSSIREVIHHDSINRIRVDSCSFSPVSKALLQYHGIMTIDKNEFHRNIKENNEKNDRE